MLLCGMQVYAMSLRITTSHLHSTYMLQIFFCKTQILVLEPSESVSHLRLTWGPQKKRAITEEARFDVDSFKTDFPNIDKKYQIRDWEPFAEPFDPYIPEMATCPLFLPLDKMRRLEGIIDLATKRAKDAPTFKKCKLTSGLSTPPLTEMLEVTTVSPVADRPAIKMAMKPVVDKLGSLCARVDMLEEEVASMREEMDRQKKMNLPMDIDLNILVVGCDSPVADRSPPDDLCVGYSPSKDLVAGEVQDCKPPRDEVLPTKGVIHHGDSYWIL
ncbi:hypothetical protein HAX54_000791 [Datura stramonium]|uniref:Uncharacterized protein n=1 Tax=Datura stramonium TaxID=4076 RepID=A0ABS8WSN8_DATST|nr:hypothetical protein [Datura stramonium]